MTSVRQESDMYWRHAGNRFNLQQTSARHMAGMCLFWQHEKPMPLEFLTARHGVCTKENLCACIYMRHMLVLWGVPFKPSQKWLLALTFHHMTPNIFAAPRWSCSPAAASASSSPSSCTGTNQGRCALVLREDIACDTRVVFWPRGAECGAQ